MIDQYQALRAVSRTFALSIEHLPRRVADPIAAAYLLLRVSDYLEDNYVMPAARKAELLRLWERVLAGDARVDELTRLVGEDKDEPEADVARNAGSILAWVGQMPEQVQTAIRRHVRDTSLGMARWQDQGPIVADEAGLDDYMHQVAGRVGYLITDIFAWHSRAIAARHEELMPLSREFGLALQTVNVVRGMRKDYERGWVFVPRTYYESLGLTHDELFQPEHLPEAMQVVNRLAEKAEQHLRKGLRYVLQMPRRDYRIRLACMWPLFFAARTLAISRDNPLVLLSEVKIGRDTVRRIVRETTWLGWSDTWVRWYYRRLSQPPQMAVSGG